MQKVIFSLSIFFIISITAHSPKRAQTQVSDTSTLKLNSQSFTFELQQCGKLEAGIACDFLITNNGSARELHLFLADSKLVNAAGQNYTASSIQYSGARRVTYNKGLGVRRVVGSGESTNGRITFARVSQPMDQIASLVIAGRVFDYEIEVLFKRIPVTYLGSGDLPVRHNTNKVAAPSLPVLPYPGRGREENFTISSINRWLDTGIRVEPGMRLVISATGTITVSDIRPSTPNPTGIDLILNERLRREGLRTERIIGTKDLRYKIAYNVGGESKAVRVGSKYAIEPDRFGILLLGVIQHYDGDTSGSINVLVQW